MTAEWAATNTLREALLSKALEYNPRGPELLDKEVPALALVETALDAADAYVKHAYPSLLTGKTDPSMPLLSNLAASLRAVREGK